MTTPSTLTIKRLSPVIVHVNQHVIKHNVKHGTALPTLTIKHPVQGTLYAHECTGTGMIVDCNALGRKPLSCGARVWMEFERDSFQAKGETCDFQTISKAMQS